VSHRGLRRAVEAVVTVTSHDEVGSDSRSFRGFGLQRSEALVGIELGRGNETSDVARLTYVETELGAVDEATRIVMIRQWSVLMESLNRANSVMALLR
jgi:hypothetical protein